MLSKAVEPRTLLRLVGRAWAFDIWIHSQMELTTRAMTRWKSLGCPSRPKCLGPTQTGRQTSIFVISKLGPATQQSALAAPTAERAAQPVPTAQDALKSADWERLKSDRCCLAVTRFRSISIWWYADLVSHRHEKPGI